MRDGNTVSYMCSSIKTSWFDGTIIFFDHFCWVNVHLPFFKALPETFLILCWWGSNSTGHIPKASTCTVVKATASRPQWYVLAWTWPQKKPTQASQSLSRFGWQSGPPSAWGNPKIPMGLKYLRKIGQVTIQSCHTSTTLHFSWHARGTNSCM